MRRHRIPYTVAELRSVVPRDDVECLRGLQHVLKLRENNLVDFHADLPMLEHL